MLKVMTLALLTLSSVAMADVELRVIWPRFKMECSIKGNEVIRNMTFGKEENVKMTQKFHFKFEGIEATARKAAELASNARPEDEMESFSMILDGKRIELNSKESSEALTLVQLMVQACQVK